MEGARDWRRCPPQAVTSRTVPTRPVLTAWLAVFLTSTACTSVSTPPSEASTFSGRVAEYDGGAADLRATALTLDGAFVTEITIGSGDIDAEGAFDFSLDRTVDPTALMELFPDERLCTGISVSDRADGGTVTAIDVLRAGQPIGVIGQATSRDVLQGALASAQPKGTLTVRVYADRRVRVEGSCSDGSATYDLELSAGWNIVDIERSETSLHLRSVETPSSAEWIYLVPATAGSAVDTAIFQVASGARLR